MRKLDVRILIACHCLSVELRWHQLQYCLIFNVLVLSTFLLKLVSFQLVNPIVSLYPDIDHFLCS